MVEFTGMLDAQTWLERPFLTGINDMQDFLEEVFHV